MISAEPVSPNAITRRPSNERAVPVLFRQSRRNGQSAPERARISLRIRRSDPTGPHAEYRAVSVRGPAGREALRHPR